MESCWDQYLFRNVFSQLFEHMKKHCVMKPGILDGNFVITKSKIDELENGKFIPNESSPSVLKHILQSFTTPILENQNIKTMVRKAHGKITFARNY